VDDLALRFAASRVPFDGIHLDSAAAGRSSRAVLSAQHDHLLLEARTGGYVAAAEVAPVLERGRSALAGLLGAEPDEVALVESATVGLERLLGAWRLPDRSRVAVGPDEWGPNLELFTRAGFEIVDLPSYRDGLIDCDRLSRFLKDARVDVVQVTQVPSHRPLVQPVAKVAAVCAEFDVPLWVDAAQAIGHVEVPSGPAAVWAPGRKWLTGPRGSGVLAVRRRWWPSLRLEASALDPELPFVQRLESSERSTAVLLGLCAAVEEHLRLGPAAVRQRLGEVGRRTRAALGEVPGWRVLPAVGGDAAITALEPLHDQDVVSTRSRLLDGGVLTTAALPARAPRSMTGALLRVSPHVDVTDDDLEALAKLLADSG
jgi:pyridoxal 5-phosphate dependent beta-lyase